MQKLTSPTDCFTDSQGNQYGLSAWRWDERHRRSRRVLPERASFSDYASLVDVVRPVPGPAGMQFLGVTAQTWLARLQSAKSPDAAAAARWLQARMESVRIPCDKRPRVPDPYFGVELVTPKMVSLLVEAIRATGQKSASARQWRGTVKGLGAKGIKAEEIELSGVLEGLSAVSDEQVLTLAEVLALIDVSPLQPRLIAESKHDFRSQSGWNECCAQVSPPNLRGLGARRRTQSRSAIRRALIRYRHRTFGWRLIREAWLPDLISAERHQWYVQDERGRLLHNPRAAPYSSVGEAMAAAEDAMRQRFRAWYRAHPVRHWSQYTAGGGEQYQEMLVQLDEWPSDYRARHFRTRNVLAHVRTSLRTATTGERLFYLDEVQSDWHADLVARAHGKKREDGKPVYDAPFAREWPLLVLKLMLWRAQAMGADALAWSSFEMQKRVWGPNRVPKALYLRTLPDAAGTLAKALGLTLTEVPVSFHAWNDDIEHSPRGWLVIGLMGTPLTRPFETRQQAERFVELTAVRVEKPIPALLLTGLPRIRRVPLYGVGRLMDWS